MVIELNGDHKVCVLSFRTWLYVPGFISPLPLLSFLIRLDP
jgi:hypothetical protein